MKKTFVLSGLLFLMLIAAIQVNAQTRQTGIGFMADFGGDTSGGSFYGPHIKYNFDASSGLEGAVLFGDGATLIQGAYQYHLPINAAPGLRGYFGGGAGIFLTDEDPVFSIPVMGGLEYAITGAPVALSFDWRPRMFFISGNEYYDSTTEFEAGRFALGLRFNF